MLTSSVSFNLYPGDLLHFSQVEAICLDIDTSWLKPTPRLNASVEEIEENGSASDVCFGLVEFQGQSSDTVDSRLHTYTVHSFVNLKTTYQPCVARPTDLPHLPMGTSLLITRRYPIKVFWMLTFSRIRNLLSKFRI